jgi:hypothetical protein
MTTAELEKLASDLLADLRAEGFEPDSGVERESQLVAGEAIILDALRRAAGGQWVSVDERSKSVELTVVMKSPIFHAWQVPSKPPSTDECPAWIVKALARGQIRALGIEPPQSIEIVYVGDIAKPGDWILRNEVGRMLMCKAETFAATFSPMPAPPAKGE